MEYNVKNIIPEYDFVIKGMSYIGNPQPNTAMFITRKVGHLLANLEDVAECLVFAETGVIIEEYLRMKNCFVVVDNPQMEYAKFANMFYNAKFQNDKKRKYTLTQEGYYIGENVHIGENAYIEPGCLIGHDVVIGKNVCLFSGVKIKNAIIGDNFIANEGAVIGAFGFTMTEDENGNKIRIPSLGKVVIGDNVEVGALNNISCGSGGNTVIEDFVKLDALIHIAHDVHLKTNVEITAGAVLGGFVNVGEYGYIGLNACLRNRITIGESSLIGMSSAVTKNVLKDDTVAGNPARVFEKRKK